MTLATVAHVRDRLAAVGFVEELIADGAQLRSVSSAQRFDPSDLGVAQLVRFRGITNGEEEGLLFALTTSDEQPVGTYAPSYRPAISPADAAIVAELEKHVISDEEVRAHRRHDHIAAIFGDRRSAQAAVDELRQLGLGSDKLGMALREGATHAFERDAEAEIVHDTEMGVAAGAVVGALAGMSLAAVAFLPGGVVGLGGILLFGLPGGLVGGMLGGYAGDDVGERAFFEREELVATKLEPGQVLVAVCSHGHPEMAEAVFERHGGQLVLRPGSG